MSAFTGELTITSLDADCTRWRLEEPLSYEVGFLGSGRRITVPEGYETDGASIPRWLWSILPAWGRYSRAALVHDYLYDCLIAGVPHKEARTRAAADEVFLEAMLVSDVSRLVAHMMWACVRLFGAHLASPERP